MNVFDVDGLPADLAAELESKFFWWEPVGLQPRSQARILAQAMNLASFDDVRRLEKALGPYRLAEAMLEAEPGWISERSWEFWRGRLALATGRAMPNAPPRRSFDAGAIYNDGSGVPATKGRRARVRKGGRTRRSQGQAEFAQDAAVMSGRSSRGL